MELEEELTTFRHLVEIMRANLKEGEEFIVLFEEYADARSSYLADPDNQRRASMLVRKAKLVQNKLINMHMEPLFSLQLREEISFFASIKGKKTT